jgi:hypothetical protein
VNPEGEPFAFGFQAQDKDWRMDAATLGRGLVYLGLGLIVIGGLVLLLGRVIDLGNLPGDLVYRGENVRVYVPIMTMILLSIVLTVLLNLALRLFR